MTTFLKTAEPDQPILPIDPEVPTLAKIPKPGRITSIDAARGFIMLTMIYVNDLAGAPGSAHVPTWMQHASDIVPRLKVHDWMTFVDMVFPGFLFIVGMSIPFAIGGRLNKGEKWWGILPHVLFRTVALIMLGVLMASGRPDGTKMPWYSAPMGVPHVVASAPAVPGAAIVKAPKLSDDDKEKLGAAKEKAGDLWIVFWYGAAFLAFCQLMPFWVKKDDVAAGKMWKAISLAVRVVGGAALLYLIIIWEKTGVDKKTHVETAQHLLTFSPFGFRYRNADILGLIGWAYLMGSVVFLCFRNRRLPLAICAALLLCFWIADKNGSFSDFYLPGFLHPVGDGISWLIGAINTHVSLQQELGSLSAITVGGVLLSSILWKPAKEQVPQGPETVGGKVRFTLWFMAAAAFAAMLLHKPFLVWKNDATPSWCLWAFTTTALVWLVFYLLGDVWKVKWLTKPFAVAGQNVLMAYLFSEGAEALFNLLPAPWRPAGVDWPKVAHFGDWYGWIGSPTLTAAISRSLGFGVALLAITAGLNWLGFRLRL